MTDKVKSDLMIAEELNTIAKKYVSYVGNPKLMNNVMANIEIKIPIEAKEREKVSSFLREFNENITLHQRNKWRFNYYKS